LPGGEGGGDLGRFPEQKFEYLGAERVAVNFGNVTRNIMRRREGPL